MNASLHAFLSPKNGILTHPKTSSQVPILLNPKYYQQQKQHQQQHQHSSKHTKIFQTPQPSLPSFEELNQQKSEALRSLSSFHDGTWIAQDGAMSFSVTSDVTAGINNQMKSLPFQTTVSTRLGFSSDDEEALKLVEAMTWEQTQQQKQPEQEQPSTTTNDTTKIGNGIGHTFFGRSCPLGDAMDVD